jgi:hypothetical protein
MMFLVLTAEPKSLSYVTPCSLVNTDVSEEAAISILRPKDEAAGSCEMFVLCDILSFVTVVLLKM